MQRMDTWLWILVGVFAALVVVVVAIGAVQRAGMRRIQERREEGQRLRSESVQRLSEAERLEAFAMQEAQRARRERAAAEEALDRAAEVDPDVPDPVARDAGTR
jgi:flagellar biosynthesis/type III secretory pathway M-ring protein FliF/YscJ